MSILALANFFVSFNLGSQSDSLLNKIFLARNKHLALLGVCLIKTVDALKACLFSFCEDVAAVGKTLNVVPFLVSILHHIDESASKTDNCSYDFSFVLVFERTLFKMENLHMLCHVSGEDVLGYILQNLLTNGLFRAFESCHRTSIDCYCIMVAKQGLFNFKLGEDVVFSRRQFTL
jgi:hypothetical protein